MRKLSAAGGPIIAVSRYSVYFRLLVTIYVEVILSKSWLYNDFRIYCAIFANIIHMYR